METKNRPRTGHASKTSYKKGQSGNPRGRPKQTEEQKQEKRDALEIMKAAAPDAARLLTEWAMDEKLRADLRIRCAETVMDRVYGKASQPIEGNLGAEIRVVIEGGEDYGA